MLASARYCLLPATTLFSLDLDDNLADHAIKGLSG